MQTSGNKLFLKIVDSVVSPCLSDFPVFLLLLLLLFHGSSGLGAAILLGILSVTTAKTVSIPKSSLRKMRTNAIELVFILVGTSLSLHHQNISASHFLLS